jgi:hypothetical protein
VSLAPLQSAIVAALTLYFLFWRRGMLRRNRQSWESLVTQLRQGPEMRDISNQRLWLEGRLTAEVILQPVSDLRGVWAMFQNARVLMEMADYAELHYGSGSIETGSAASGSMDRMSLQTLRSDAMMIRMYALVSMPRYAFSF